MQYAIIQTGGKQYKVSPGTILEVDRLKDTKESVSFDKVLLLVDGTDVKIGNPYLKDVVVNGKVLEEIKGEKIRVSKFLAKSRYRKTIGFRALLSKVEIKGIEGAKKA